MVGILGALPILAYLGYVAIAGIVAAVTRPFGFMHKNDIKRGVYCCNGGSWLTKSQTGCYGCCCN